MDNETTEWSSNLTGAVQINNLGDFNYEITVGFTDKDGNPATAYYNGKLNYVLGE